MTSHSVDHGPGTGSSKGDDLTGARVLVVHHDPTFAEPLAMALRFSGFRVRHASSGGEGLAATGPDWPPDLVVLNVTPDLGQLNIVRRLRANRPRLPVVFLIAWGEVSGKVARLTRETDSYITRPFALLEVTARVRTVLMRTREGSTTSPEKRRKVDRTGRHSFTPRGADTACTFIRPSAPSHSPRNKDDRARKRQQDLSVRGCRTTRPGRGQPIHRDR